jgi:hypothetical protein
MSVRYGANGQPLPERKVETVEEVVKESSQPLQEILEVNPNVLVMDEPEEAPVIEEDDTEEE